MLDMWQLLRSPGCMPGLTEIIVWNILGVASPFPNHFSGPAPRKEMPGEFPTQLLFSPHDNSTWARRFAGPEEHAMRFPNAKSVLSTLPKRNAVIEAESEVAVAEEIAKMLSTLVDAHWREAPHETVRSLVRQAEALLVKVGG